MKLEVSLQKRLGDFSFSADFLIEGQRTGLYGPSGSGKSTLMHMLAGLLKPDAGFIRLDDETLFNSRSGVNQKPEKRRIGVVFQHAHLFPHMGVQSNLLYGYKRRPAKERKIDPEALINILGLAPLLERGVDSLSGGERQRVALGRTILCCPRLILMDEPMTGLDSGLKYQIIPYLKNVFAEFGIPLLLISHSLNEMRLMTDHVLEFSKGRITAETTAHDLARNRLGTSQTGYINLMEMTNPQPHDGFYSYRWGEQEISLSAGGDQQISMFELSSKDITLFKRHPEATSARNMLKCRVKQLFESGQRIGVELDCNGQSLISQVVSDAVRDLELKPDAEIIAVVKASAFRRLY
jgi:molybdate transport system ATP-binding protein